MSDKSLKFTVRLPGEFQHELERLQKTKGHETLSSLVRAILIDAIHNHRRDERLGVMEQRLLAKLENIEAHVALLPFQG